MIPSLLMSIVLNMKYVLLSDYVLILKAEVARINGIIHSSPMHEGTVRSVTLPYALPC